MTAQYKLELQPISNDTDDPAARPVLDKAMQQVGFIPNMYSHMVNSPALLDTYLHGYAHFRENSGFTPAEQEVVFLVISDENNCHYCTAAHSMLADKKSGVPADIRLAIIKDQNISDPKISALADFTRIMVNTCGLPDTTQVKSFLAAGYSERHILDIILAISVKTLSNYSNHLFHTPVDDMFSAYV